MSSEISMAFEGELPKLATVVHVQEVFTHCPKAFVRSKLWSDEYRIDRSELPSFGEILRDHAGLDYDLEKFQKGLDDRLVTTLH
jgi:hypothetical protein